MTFFIVQPCRRPSPFACLPRASRCASSAALSVAIRLGIDEVWALIVPNGRQNEEALQKHCRDRLAQRYVPVRFINVADIPCNANGKVDRSRLDAMVQGLVRSGASD
jgi:acyl-CoA synthetase (AMP-forming)/AMP-acid ligase II